MGLMEALEGGLSEAAGGAAKIGFDMIQSQIDQDRQAALLRIQEETQKRLTEHRAETGLMSARTTRKEEFAEKVANAPQETEMAVGRAKAEAQARGEVERETARGKAQDTLEFQSKNLKQLTGNARAIALANHIVDPQIELTPKGDGTFMRYDKRSGKALGVLTDPQTGEPIVGKKDISESQMAAAKASFAIAEKIAETDPEKAKTSFDKGMQILGMGEKPAIQSGALSIGQVVEGYKFKGGDPKNKANWEKTAETEKPAILPKTEATSKQTFNKPVIRDERQTRGGRQYFVSETGKRGGGRWISEAEKQRMGL